MNKHLNFQITSEQKQLLSNLNFDMSEYNDLNINLYQKDKHNANDVAKALLFNYKDSNLTDEQFSFIFAHYDFNNEFIKILSLVLIENIEILNIKFNKQQLLGGINSILLKKDEFDYSKLNILMEKNRINLLLNKIVDLDIKKNVICHEYKINNILIEFSFLCFYKKYEFELNSIKEKNMLSRNILSLNTQIKKYIKI